MQKRKKDSRFLLASLLSLGNPLVLTAKYNTLILVPHKCMNSQCKHERERERVPDGHDWMSGEEESEWERESTRRLWRQNKKWMFWESKTLILDEGFIWGCVLWVVVHSGWACCFGDINFGLYKGNFEILVYPVDAGTAIGLYKPMSFCSHLKKS